MMDGMSLLTVAVAPLLLLFAALNLKALPLAHSFRLLPSVYRLFRPRLSSRAPTKSPGAAALGPRRLFEPFVMRSRAVPLDLDINMHKSNSTYFADADVSRAEMLTRLFSRALVDVAAGQAAKANTPRAGAANIILAGVQARFVREIKPFQEYELVSSVLTWDESAVFVVSYFVKPGGAAALESNGSVDGKGPLRRGPAAILSERQARGAVFAVLLSKYVVRMGRTKVLPADLLEAGGLLPQQGDANFEATEQARLEGLDYVKNCMQF